MEKYLMEMNRKYKLDKVDFIKKLQEKKYVSNGLEKWFTVAVLCVAEAYFIIQLVMYFR